jgi:basic amino acid/polyamine antiporter, APA family
VAITTTKATAVAAPVEQTLFVRKASGLVKGWSSTDGFFYAFLSVNLGMAMYSFSYAAWIPGGSLFWSIVIAAALVLLEVVVYAGLISAMPRAGGDYVWQSRIFNSPIGFVMGVTGWWFIMWMWIPIYAAITVGIFIKPVFRILEWNGAADWLGTQNGVFVGCMVVLVVTTTLAGIGMKAYAKFQKWALLVGMIGFVAMLVVLAVTSKDAFITAFNRESLSLYGTQNAYAEVLKAGGEGQPSGIFDGTLWQTLLLVPFMCFWILWANWGATLYGEIRGAKNFRMNIYQMGGGLIGSSALALILIALIGKTMGWKFFMASQAAQGVYSTEKDYLSPVAMASWIVDNKALQIILILVVMMIVIAWWGTIFLSSTRVVFAAAFDRVLPEKAAAVTSGGVPWVALLLMLIPSIVTSALYSYTSWFATLTYDGTLVIVATFFVTVLAAIVMPWRIKRIWKASALPKAKLAGIPVMTLIAVACAVFLGFVLYEFLKNSVYGTNNKDSLIYMGVLYGIALLIWVIAAVVRRREGAPLGDSAKEIPFE